MLAVDPSDGCTFWYTNSYYAATKLERLADPDRELRVPILSRTG
ncbi:MAG: hypothetical protein M5R38_13605 [Candidatus Methylomirabilis sp.]|nr:hypothetical protein [Candidatus Methylomirabilis sp.]